MKNKYITNDLVKLGEGTYKIVGPVILGGIWGEDTVPLYDIVPMQGEYFATVAKEEQLDGIPLTPEILEKNGWEKVAHHVDEDDFTWDVYQKEGCMVDLNFYPNDGNDFSAFWCGQEILPDLRYVHQLQHLLFGLGLENKLVI